MALRYKDAGNRQILGKNNGQYSITVGRFLNVDPFIVTEFAIFV
jgi:hypothetical protein